MIEFLKDPRKIVRKRAVTARFHNGLSKIHCSTCVCDETTEKIYGGGFLRKKKNQEKCKKAAARQLISIFRERKRERERQANI